MRAKQHDHVSHKRAVGQAMPTPREPDAATCFVINLCSSMMPISRADLPDLPVLRKYKLFVSRRKEDGRERHRLHLGFFSSDTEATRVVVKLRRSFPAAWVVRANVEDMRRLRKRKPTELPPTNREPESATVRVEPDARTTAQAHEEYPSHIAVEEADVDGLVEAFDDASEPEVYYGPGIPGSSKRATPRTREQKQPQPRPAAAPRPRSTKIEIPDDSGTDYMLSDSARVKHLSVKPKEPSITSRILGKFTKLKKHPDDPGH